MLFSLYSQVENNDTTFTTQSQLQFEASRYEDGHEFKCEADNIIMQNKPEKPLSHSLNLIVFCKLMCN